MCPSAAVGKIFFASALATRGSPCKRNPPGHTLSEYPASNKAQENNMAAVSTSKSRFMLLALT